MPVQFQNFLINNPRLRTVPSELKDLYDYAARNNGQVIADFEIKEDLQEMVAELFDDEEEPTNEFAMFGQDALGGLYGFWLYNGKSADDAPIVYLDAEGCGNTVLADSVEEFLSLLSSGRNALGRIDLWPDTSMKTNEDYNRWLKRMQILPVKNPKAFVERAREKHPSLEMWLINKFSTLR